MLQLDLAELRCDGRARTGYVERWARRQGLSTFVGVDEAGRGPLAGPVVAAAIVLPERHGIVGLDDSKRLTPDQRTELAAALRGRARVWAVVEVCARDIDRDNILRSALRAMAVAVGRVVERLGSAQRPDLVLVDGNATLPIALPQRPIVAGDHYSETIAAASILAKVHRDAVMRQYHSCWPHYGFDHNFGYGTAEHLAALRSHGPCPIHRRSFRGTTFDHAALPSPLPATLPLL